MGAHQESSFSQPIHTKNIWFLLTTLTVLIFLFFTAATYQVSRLHHAQKNHAAALLSDISELLESHKSLRLHTRDGKTHELDVRGIGDLFSGLLGGGGSGAASSGSSSSSSGGITGLLSSAASSLLGGGSSSSNGSLTSGLVNDLVSPAKFLSMGLAGGALTGLNMTTTMPMNATGLDAVAMNLGSGLTGPIFASPNVSSLFASPLGTTSAVQLNSSNSADGMFGGASGMVGQAVLALSQGLGSGTVQGLKLNAAPAGSAYNTSGLNGIAGNFGQGLTSTVVGGMNISLPSLSAGSLLSSFTKRETGLRRSAHPDLLSFVRREFEKMDPKKKRDMAAGTISMIADLAEGLGTGLGQGTAVGLGFQNASEMATTAPGVTGITQNFASGLTSSFLSNNTLTKIVQAVSPQSGNSSSLSLSSLTGGLGGLSGAGGMMQNLDVSKVAEGFAVGLMSGAGSQVSSLQLIAANTSGFNDSVDGAATGFGHGLGSEGAKLASAFVANGLPAGLSIPGLTKREVVGSSHARRHVVPVLGKRQSTPVTSPSTASATDISSVITNVNASAINPILQTGVDDLTCKGIGGMAGIFLGLIDSKTINLTTNNNNNLTLPDQLFVVRNMGNTYAVNPSKGISGVSVNGLTVIQVAIIGAIHIIFAITAWLNTIPLLLLFNSTSKLALFFQPRSSSNAVPPLLRKLQPWMFWSSIPLSLIGFVFGIVFVGNGKHLRSAHGILSYLLFVLTIISAVMHVYLNPSLLPGSKSSTPTAPPKNLVLAYKGVIAILFVMSTATFLTGFGDLSSLSFCVIQEVISFPAVMFLGVGIMSTWMTAIGVNGLKTWITSRFPEMLTSGNSFDRVDTIEKVGVKTSVGFEE